MSPTLRHLFVFLGISVILIVVLIWQFNLIQMNDNNIGVIELKPEGIFSTPIDIKSSSEETELVFVEDTIPLLTKESEIPLLTKESEIPLLTKESEIPLLTKESESERVNNPKKVNLKIQKTQINKVRLVFLVGLEGTGHHGFPSILNNCENCAGHRTLEATIWRHMSAVPSSFIQYEKGLLLTRRILRELNTSTTPRTIFLNAHNVETRHDIGMLSYPNFEGVDKSLQYVNLPLIARLCEESGVDFRIVYLHRIATDIVYSTTFSRTFGKRDQLGIETSRVREVMTLVNNANVLQSYLSQLDTKFYICLNMSDPSIRKKGKFIETHAFYDTNSTDFADKFRRMRELPHHESKIFPESYMSLIDELDYTMRLIYHRYC